MVSYNDNLEITVNVPPYAYNLYWHTWKRNACCDVISRGLHHNYMLAYILQLPQKVWLIYVYVNYLQCMYVQMHVHKIFSPCMIYAVDIATYNY